MVVKLFVCGNDEAAKDDQLTIIKIFLFDELPFIQTTRDYNKGNITII